MKDVYPRYGKDQVNDNHYDDDDDNDEKQDDDEDDEFGQAVTRALQWFDRKHSIYKSKYQSSSSLSSATCDIHNKNKSNAWNTGISSAGRTTNEQSNSNDSDLAISSSSSSAGRFLVRQASSGGKGVLGEGGGGYNSARLVLDFSHLMIGHGIPVEALSARIRAKVPRHIPICVSFRCCRMMNQGGVQAMQRFLAHVPHHSTFLNIITWLWFDYEEISNVVLGAAKNLKQLELPLGHQLGISQVLKVCLGIPTLTELSFISRNSFLETETVREVLHVLPLLKQVKVLQFDSFQCTDQSLHLLLSGLRAILASHNNSLQSLHLSYQGNGGSMMEDGLDGITAASLPMWTRLLQEMSDRRCSTKLCLKISNVPRLFQYASVQHVRDFVGALRQQTCLQRLELDHVGLTGFLTARLWPALADATGPLHIHTGTAVTLVGANLLRGGQACVQLLKHLPLMNSISCLAIIDTESTLEQVGLCSDNHDDDDDNLKAVEALVTAAVFANYRLEHLTLRIGSDCLYPIHLDDIFQRNSSLVQARYLIAHHAKSRHCQDRDVDFDAPMDHPNGLWAHVLYCFSDMGGKYGADPMYQTLQHLFATRSISNHH